MIIEFLVIKLTLEAILEHCNNLAYQQEIREKASLLKAELLKLASDYEGGTIDQKTYAEKEAEIMARLSKLAKQVSSYINNNNNTRQTFDAGLGLLS